MQRAASFSLLAIFLLSGVPLATAQNEATGAAALHGVDAANDVTVTGPASAADDDQYRHLDILEFWIDNETLETVDFGLRLTQLEPDATDPLGLGSREVGVRFEIGTRVYLVGVVPNCGTAGAYGMRSNYDNGYSTYCGGFEERIDAATNTFVMTVRREILVNETQYPFGPGVPLRNVYAAAVATNVPLSAQQATTTAQDRAPNEGFLGDFTSGLGNLTGAGGLTLFAAEPIRTSNGESTTLVFPLALNNTNTFDVTALLTVENAIDSWDVRVPSRIIVPAQGVVLFPVILSMEFDHRHGELAMFKIRAEDAKDAARWAGARLGVFWLDTPQPAGHHDKLWFHSGGGWSSQGFGFGLPYDCATVGLWMNPLEVEPEGGESGEEVPGCVFDDGATYPNGQVIRWGVPLEPELQIGLDFDMSRSGRFQVDIRSRAGVPASAALTAELLYCDPTGKDNRETVMADCPGAWITLSNATSAPQTFGAESKRSFELELVPTPEADFLPYKKEAQLWMLLELQSDRPLTPPNRGDQDVSPMLDPKSALLTLPLVEYHDPVDQAFAAVGALELASLSPFEKPANPGQTVTFEFRVQNRGAQAQTLLLTAEGHNEEWVRFPKGSEIRVPSGATANVTLLVDVPFEASEGERAELFLIAESKSDPNVVSLARLRTVVVDPATQKIEQDGDASGDDRESTPSTAWWVSAITAFSVPLAFRRRNN
jgi:hypothetical protein